MASIPEIDPLDDLSREVFPTDIPFWSESAAFWAYPEERDFDLYVHYQRQVDDPGIWKSMLVLLLKDGDALVMKSFGRQPDKNGQGGHEMHSKCLEPGKRWRFRYDSAAQRVKQADLWKGLLTDGIVEPLFLDIEFTAIAPLWRLDPENLEDHGNDVMMHVHYEQAFRTDGVVRIGGKERHFKGHGYRDHSYGPRNYTRMGPSQIVYGLFPSDRAFWFITGLTPEGEYAHCEGAIAVDGTIYPAEISNPPFHGDIVTGGKEYIEYVLKTELGEARIKVRYAGMGIPFSLKPPAEERIGAEGGIENVKQAYWEANLISEWDGEEGIGSGQGTIWRD